MIFSCFRYYEVVSNSVENLFLLESSSFSQARWVTLDDIIIGAFEGTAEGFTASSVPLARVKAPISRT